VDLRRIEQRHHVLALAALVAQRGDGGGCIALQPIGEALIAPGFGDDAGAVARTHFRLIGLDQHVERGGIDIAFFDKERFQRLHPKCDGRKFRALMVVIVSVVRHLNFPRLPLA
jgi:hypothetical protein